MIISSLLLTPVQASAFLGISSSQGCNYSWCAVLAQPLLVSPQHLSHHSWQRRHCQGIHEVVLLSLSCALLCGDLLRHLEIEVEKHSLGLWSRSEFRSSLIYTITILEYFRWMSACWVVSCSWSPFTAGFPGWMHPLRCNLSPLRGRGDWDHWRAFWMREEETNHSSEDATQKTILCSAGPWWEDTAELALMLIQC